MSAITEAFSELYTAQTEATGGAITADFDVAGEVAVVIGSAGFDDILNGGGVSESGTVEVQALASLFDNVKPVKFSTCTLQGVERHVVGEVKESHGVYTIPLGDPTVT